MLPLVLAMKTKGDTVRWIAKELNRLGHVRSFTTHLWTGRGVREFLKFVDQQRLKKECESISICMSTNEGVADGGGKLEGAEAREKIPA